MWYSHEPNTLAQKNIRKLVENIYEYIIYEISYNLISIIIRLDYHDYNGKVRNEFENICRDCKIFGISIYFIITKV